MLGGSTVQDWKPTTWFSALHWRPYYLSRWFIHKFVAPPQLWAFATAWRDSHEVPSAAVAAQMSWNTFKTEEVSWAEVICGQLCLFIHFSHIQHVFSVFEPLPRLHYFSTWQKTNGFTTLHHPVGGGKIHLMSSQCLCEHLVLLIPPEQTSYSHWNWPHAQRHFVEDPNLCLSTWITP